jgi:hypothetical protein
LEPLPDHLGSGNKHGFQANFRITPRQRLAQDNEKTRSQEEPPMRIESVELVALPNAPSWQEKVYRAHMDTGEAMDLFQQHWDVPLPPESLVGLTVEEARKKRNERMFAIASGNH